MPLAVVNIKGLQSLYSNGMRLGGRIGEENFFGPFSDMSRAEKVARSVSESDGLRAGYVIEALVSGAEPGAFDPSQQRSPERQNQSNSLDLPPIEVNVVQAFFGPGFVGLIPGQYGMRGMNATDQFVALTATRQSSRMDFNCEIQANNEAVFLHYPFWRQHDFFQCGIQNHMRDKVCADIRRIWSVAFPSIRLSALDTTAF